MKSGSGVAAVAYAPSSVAFSVGETAVSITETTDYPFKGDILLEVSAKQNVVFPLALRVPGWAKTARITVNGEAVALQPTDGFVTIEREWHSDDTVLLSLPMEIRAQGDFNNSLTLHRGPLVLSLPIKERWEAVGNPYTALEQRAQEWALAPQSEWNYALALDASAIASLTARETEIGEQPFAAENPPLGVTVPLRKVEGWGVQNFSAEPPPTSPVETAAPVETLDLVPYGCARLRLTTFPVAAK